MRIAESVRTSGWQRLGALLLAGSLYGCSSSGTASHEAGAGGAGGGAIEAADAGGGAPGLGDAALTADGAGAAPGTGDATGAPADLGIGGGGAGGGDGGVVPGDARLPGGDDSSPGDGRLAGTDGGMPSDRIGNDGSAPGDGANARDTGINDVPAPQVPDAAGDARQIDAPVGQDSAGDAVKGDGGGAGDSGATACIPDFSLWLSATLPEVQETYDLCEFPTGSAATDVTTWVDHFWDGTLSLVDAHTCVEDGDPRIRVATGTPFRGVLAANPATSGRFRPPLRIYAIHQELGAAQVRAAYDLSLLSPDAGTLPPYPERYVRLDLVCGDSDAIPRLKGWTGRIGLSRTQVWTGGDSWVLRLKFALWGSAAGETGERGLWFVANLPAVVPQP